jgi:hypothetical protein
MAFGADSGDAIIVQNGLLGQGGVLRVVYDLVDCLLRTRVACHAEESA